MRPQQTLGRAIACSGIGLHTGRTVSLTLRPAPPDTGIVFIQHGAAGRAILHALVENLLPAQLCTAIGNSGATVRTVEHVLSALAGLGVDNAFVDVDADEVPVMDGSAGPFVRMIRAAGVVPQERRQPFLKILQPIEIADGQRRVLIEPAASTRITYTIQYDHPLIKTQTYRFDWSESAFENEIAEARTFGFLKEVQYLWSKGLGKGGSLDNTVVLSEQGVINGAGLRYDDEFVRHKVLDLIGDVALLGVPFIGHLIADRSGHALHTRLVEEILAQPDKWVLLTAGNEQPATGPTSRVRRDSTELRHATSPDIALPVS